MEIRQVKTALKIGEFVLRKGHRNKIDLNYSDAVPKETLTADLPRVYLFVVDDIIKKIGGSSGKGGIKNTMNFYVSAMTGSPGVPRFVLHLLIEKELKKGKKVELYMITSPTCLAEVNGLFSSKKIEIASFKEMEDFCKTDYFSIEKRFPDWNFQENNDPYPQREAKLHNEYHKKRLRDKRL